MRRTVALPSARALWRHVVPGPARTRNDWHGAVQAHAEPRCRPLESGLNVYGYLRAEHGVGEQARQFVKIAQKATIPYSAIPYTRTGSRQNDSSIDLGAARAVYDKNLLFVNADSLGVFVRDVGQDLLRYRYNIGIWAWETARMPRAMGRACRFLDEIWTCSAYSAIGIATAARVPVRVFPPAVTTSPVVARTRAAIGLPEGPLFLFCFDYNSIFERKNPVGVVEAFRTAFPREGVANLVIKSVNAPNFRSSAYRLSRAASGRRDISIVDGYLSPDHQRELVASCDAYVSLHRAEGFGFTLAEAMSLGKPVIGTAFSGTLEFMEPHNSYLVPHEMVAIPSNCRPYAAPGECWAAPDHEEAARALRHVVEHPTEARLIGAAAQRDIGIKHSIDARVPALREHLAAIEVPQRRGGPRLVPVMRRVAATEPDSAPYTGYEDLRALLATQPTAFRRPRVHLAAECGRIDGVRPGTDGNAIVWGWAYRVTDRQDVEEVVVVVDGKQLPWRVAVELPRPDVADHLGTPGALHSGWSCEIPVRDMVSAAGRVDVYAVLGPRLGLLGSRTISRR